ncbi:hypothetical protein [Gordonia sp. DT101]|uniref:hypothetical protein n=1 Tax=Gordonia sp. DT101 TaxID=3416545 RepID=UPI003CECBF9B
MVESRLIVAYAVLEGVGMHRGDALTFVEADLTNDTRRVRRWTASMRCCMSPLPSTSAR